MKTGFFTLFLAVVLAWPAATFADECPEPAVTGEQPCDEAITDAYERAASNTLGSDGPDLGMIGMGRPSTPGAARFPCALLAAIGQTESSWRQFSSVGTCGGTGPTLISFDCGYGIMQITSGMDGSGGFEPARVAADSVYNIGTGARILGQKWRTTPFIGDNNPDIIECWYYATWAYNGFSYINNPHNPRYPASRVPFRSEGSGARSDYPYQEIVWGYLRKPIADRWPVIEVSYPNTEEICGTESGCFPGNLTMPSPGHTGSCHDAPIEIDAGVPDAGAPDDAATDDAAIDAAVVDAFLIEDAAAADAASPPPVRGCQCSSIPSTRPLDVAMLVLVIGLLAALRVSRKRATKRD